MVPRLPDRTDLSFQDRLKFAVLRLIHEFSTDEEIEETVGRSMKQLGRYIEGADLPFSILVRIAKYSRVPIWWLIENNEDYLALGKRTVEADLALIPRYEVQAGAGSGLVPVSEVATEALAFRRDWLRQIGVSPQQAALVTADGDSMAPTIPDRSIMLVDLAIRDVRNGHIYILIVAGAVVVKRVQINTDRTVVLISDNSRYDREVISQDRLADLHIAGRVVWVGHMI